MGNSHFTLSPHQLLLFITSFSVCLWETCNGQFIREVGTSVGDNKLTRSSNDFMNALEDLPKLRTKRGRLFTRPVTLDCRDSGGIGTCIRHKAMNQCKFPSVRSVCPRTCNACQYRNWEQWGAWSECSVTCSFGVLVRTRMCLHIPCHPAPAEEMRTCQRPPCNLASIRGRAASTDMNLYDPDGKDAEEVVCNEQEFACPNTKQCFDKTRECDGDTDCGSGHDEEFCELGLRHDGRFGIINWKYHKCAEANITEDGWTFPQMYRRCPGHYNKKIQKFTWTWFSFDNIQHLGTYKCLALNVTLSNTTEPNKLDVIMTSCDQYDLKQHWMCSGYYIRLLHPYDVVPEENRDEIYLKVSDDGPGNRLVLTSETDETTEFYMLGTNKRLSICAKRGYGSSVIWNFWGPCDKTCGGGIRKKKSDCAINGEAALCGGKDKYETRPCNTEPCAIICPPEFAVHRSVYNEKDINCFKVYDDPKTFVDAQKFCAASNWTLAADKDFRGHQFILDLMGDVTKAYIGVHEDLTARIQPPYPHLLRYHWDGQPLDGFQRWYQYTDAFENRGCTVGFGSIYYGSIAIPKNGKACEYWNTTNSDEVDEEESALLKIISSYDDDSSTGNGSNYCRNPDLSENSPWCRVMHKNKFYKETCDIPDCLDVKTKSVPENKDLFMIHSLEGDQNFCIAVLSTDKVVTTSCDCTDNRQNFYWWAGASLVNVGSGKCLAVASLPPKDRDEIVVENCLRQNLKSNQGWSTHELEISLAWIPDAGEIEGKPPLYHMDHDSKKKKVLITDSRMELFTVWNPDTGMLRLSRIMSFTPAGNFFLLKGQLCEACIKSVLDSRQLTTGVCDLWDIHQRWNKLNDNVLMNIATGLCLSSYRMRFYVLLEECNLNNNAIQWKIQSGDRNSVFLLHSVSGFYLTCDCTGYTQVCLTPDEIAWNFIVNEELSIDSNIPDEDGVSGYSFMLRATHNLTNCARPAKSPQTLDDKYSVIMTTCQLEDRGQLWWFSESGMQIKHRGLDLCLEVQISRTSKGIVLAPCSMGRLNVQAWIFKHGPGPRDIDDLPGDFACLRSNHSICLIVELGEGFGKDDELLSVIIKTRSRQWTAVVSGGRFFVPLGKVKDCVPPWMEMKDYRGNRSWSKDGIECQNWNHQWPHRHPFTNESHPTAGLDQNFCRKPHGIPSDKLDELDINEPWCLSMNPSLPWQDCSIARCPVTGVILHSGTGLWEATNGVDVQPFICHAMPECYLQHGEDYSGYYEHTGRGPCLNWREFYGGDENWPDHARCMNWNNDTMKPWCWVAKGVAQYCDLIVPCPKRCPDPAQRMRNMYIRNITYASPSKLYMPKSSIQVTCKRGYNLTIPGQIHQIWNCTNDAEWVPNPIPCRKIFCHRPAAVDNSIVITRKTVFTYGAVAVYQCKDGYMIEPGRTLIEIECLLNGTWSSLPYKCIPACKEGWTPFNQSCYRLNHERKHFHDYQSALAKCSEQDSGSLAVPKTILELELLRDLIAVSRGFTDEYYWVGIRDTYQSKSSGIKVQHNWIGDGYGGLIPEEKLYLEPLRNNSFMIKSFGASMEDEDLVPYNDRCMFGDSRTKKVATKSCMYNDGVGMQWMWATNEHLYNVDAELCLHAIVHDFSPYVHTMPNSVSLKECDPHDEGQIFTCGPENGLFLRLKHDRLSYIALDHSDVEGEIRIGSAKAPWSYATWHTYPGYYYLCHWNYKKPDPIFLVHKDRTPNFFSFFEQDLDPCQEKITGAILANTTSVETYMEDETLDWCACAFVIDEDGKKVNMMPNSLGKCYSLGLASDAVKEGLRKCKDQTFADSLCHRTEKNWKKQYAWMENCVAINAPNSRETHLTVRDCRTTLPGYICEEPATWACPKPKEPKNSIPVFETGNTDNMKFTYQATVEIYCKEGYWIESRREPSVPIVCNKYLNWEVFEKAAREGDEAFFTDNHKDREDMMQKLTCTKIRCDDPPKILGMTLIGVTDRKNYFTAIATYECLEGTWLSSNEMRHNMTCMADGTWQPMLRENEMCKSVTCPEPLPLRNANFTHTGLVFGSNLTYTCHSGFWISQHEIRAHGFCDKDGKWAPDHNKLQTSCVPISCLNPSKEMLSRANMYNLRERTTYGYQSILNLACDPGYWFDKDTSALNFTCDKIGIWQPFPPRLIRCKRIFCKYPDDVAGAIRFGTDFASGSHVRYYCARRNWIRRQFQIHSPHWRLCVKLSDVILPSSKVISSEVASFGQVILDENCGNKATPYHWWIWHWSYHLKNRATNLCLTAAAIPSLKENYVPVTAEPCEKNNIFQMWSCSAGSGNEWMVGLLASSIAGYLSPVTDDQAFWSGKGKINLYVTGDIEAIGAENYWKIFGSNDENMNICLMKEGQFFEESICNSVGDWYPDPRDFECTRVMCLQPPDVPNAEISAGEIDGDEEEDPEKQEEEKSYPRWENLIPPLKEYEVTSKLTFKCELGYWIMPQMYEFSTTCLDNSLWQPDPRKVECVEVGCPKPIMMPRKEVTFKKAKKEGKEKNLDEIESLSLIPEFKGDASFLHYTNITFEPTYEDVIILKCYPGYWFLRNIIETFEPDKFISSGMDGNNVLEAHCMWNGTWSLSNIHDALECVPLYCYDPGAILNAQRISDTKTPVPDMGEFANSTSNSTVARSGVILPKNLEIYGHNSVLQYQCDLGFWFSISQTYNEIRCNESGRWSPDIDTISCKPVSCGDPGTVVDAVKFGEDYSVFNEVTYKCNEGFRIGNSFKEQKVQCMRDGKWFPPIFSIRCDRIECGDIPRVSHSFLKNKSQEFEENFMPGDKIIIQCEPGYQLEYTAISLNFECGLQGKWIPNNKDNAEIHCTPAICPNPPKIENRTIINPQTQYFVNDTVYYSCPKGRKAETIHNFVNEVICKVNFTSGEIASEFVYMTYWDPDPLEMKCEAVSCPHPGLIKNSSLVISGREYEDLAVYTCNRGYCFKQYNASIINIYCGRFGKWSPDVSTLKCSRQQCSQPLLNDMVEIEPKRLSVYHYGDRVKITCPSKHLLKLAETEHGRSEIALVSECSEDGSWTVDTSLFICEAIYCKHPGVIDRAIVLSDPDTEFKDLSVSSKLHITCQQGYVLSVTGKIYSEFECSEQGLWEPVDLHENTPACVPVLCSDPGLRNNSVRHLDGHLFGNRVTYKASPGYYLPSRELEMSLICSSDGKWDSETQKEMFTVRSLPLTLNLENNTLLRTKREATEDSSEISFIPSECEFPSNLSSNSYIQEVNYTEILGYKANLTISCNDGFVIALETTTIRISCTEMGWIPQPENIHCLPADTVFCELPSVIPRTVILGSSYHVGSVATVMCESGYEISNVSLSMNITCNDDGIWVPPPTNITCKRVLCNPPPIVNNTKRSYSTVTYGSETTYECETGYTFEDPNIDSKLHVICKSSNLWYPDPLQYKCEPANCGPPPNIPYGSFTYNSTEHGSVANSSCDKGHILSVAREQMFSAQITCNSRGFWTIDPNSSKQEIIQCVPVTCDSSRLPYIGYSNKYILAKNYYKSKAIYQCKTGYETPTKSKSFSFVCSHDGTWKAVDIQLNETLCGKVQCPVIELKGDRAEILYKMSDGTFLAKPVQHEFEAQMKYFCKSKKRSAAMYQCSWYGEWEPQFEDKCSEIRCPEPPEMEYAVGKGDQSLGASWKYSCQSGYEIRHHVMSVDLHCVLNDNSEGIWVPPYNSIMRCRKPSCEKPRIIPQYTRVFDKTGKELLASSPEYEFDLALNSNLTFRCEEGYWQVPEKIYERRSICNSDRQWDPNPKNLISCTMVMCESPPEVKEFELETAIASEHYWFNTSVSYKCPDGAFVKALKKKSVKSTCGPNGVFLPNATTLRCSNTVCEEYMMPHADLTVLTGLKMGDTASYLCHTGYWFQVGFFIARLTCREDGEWLPDVSTHYCKKVTCQMPKIKHVAFDEDMLSKTVEHENEIDVFCEDGYYLSNPDKAMIKTLTCGSDGKYRPPVEQLLCMPIPCKRPYQPPNSTVYGDFYYGGKAYEQCKYGTWTQEHENRVSAECQRDGTWSKNFQQEDFLCRVVECSIAPEIENTIRQGNGTSFNTKIKYLCIRGFWLAAELENRYELIETCLANGAWSPFPPSSCERIICPELPEISSANVFGDKPWFESVFTYVCKPMKWIAIRTAAGWSLTGEKEFNVTCGKDARWYPPPITNCISLYDAQIINKDHRKRPPFQKLSSKLPKKWINFNPQTMTLSDSKTNQPTVLQNATSKSYRDIRFLWDANPLTFWVGAKNASNDDQEWKIDIYFGKPIALFAIMIMCADDTASDIGNFSIIFADSKNRVKEMGPFKVYGDGVIQGRLALDFPLRFASMANTFVFNGIAEEILWLHIVIRPLYDGQVPAIREIGFYASDLKQDWIYISSPTAPISIALAFVLMALILSPTLYLIEGRKYRQIVVLFKKTKSCKNKNFRLYRVEIQASRVDNINCRLLFQVCGTMGESPVVYLRKDFFPRSVQKGFAFEIYFAEKDFEKLGEIQNIRLVSWNESAADEDCEFAQDDEEILNITEVNVREMDETEYSYEAPETFVLKQLTSTSFIFEKEHFGKFEEFQNTRNFKILCCNMLLSLFYPPPGSQFFCAERFLCLISTVVGGCVITLYLQFLFHAHILDSPGPDIISQPQSVTSEVLTALFGSVICVSIPLFARCLSYGFNQLGKDARETRVVAHRIADALVMKEDPVLSPDAQSALRVFFDLLVVKDVATSIAGLNLKSTRRQRRWSEGDFIPLQYRDSEFASLKSKTFSKSWPDLIASKNLKRQVYEEIIRQKAFGSFLLYRHSVTLATLSFTQHTSSFASWDASETSSITESSSTVHVESTDSILTSSIPASKLSRVNSMITDSATQKNDDGGDSIDKVSSVFKKQKFFANKFGKLRPVRKSIVTRASESGDFSKQQFMKRLSKDVYAGDSEDSVMTPSTIPCQSIGSVTEYSEGVISTEISPWDAKNELNQQILIVSDKQLSSDAYRGDSEDSVMTQTPCPLIESASDNHEDVIPTEISLCDSVITHTTVSCRLIESATNNLGDVISTEISPPQSDMLNQQILIPSVTKSIRSSIFHACLSPVLIISIVSLSAYMIYLGQKVGTDGAGNFFSLAMYSILFTLCIVLPLDMLLAVFVFKEHLFRF